MLPKPLAASILIVVTIVWAANFVAQFVIANYQPDPILHGVFMSLVGGALALTRQDKHGPKDKDRPSDDESAEPGRHHRGGR